MSISRGSFSPNELEQRFVHKVYDAIAESFSDSRYAPWPGVVHFLRARPPGAWGADIGCGNGKYLLAVEQKRETLERIDILPLLASDSSFRLAETVRARGFDVVVANMLFLPYRQGLLDFFICIAVLHHLATPARRIEGIRRMSALLTVGGEGLIQVWAKDQTFAGEPAVYVDKKKPVGNSPISKDVIEKKRILVEPPPGLPFPVQTPRTPFVAPDVLLPWNRKRNQALATTPSTSAMDDEQIVRYYHVFEEGELEALIQQVDGLEVIESNYEQGNWAVTIRKVA